MYVCMMAAFIFDAAGNGTVVSPLRGATCCGGVARGAYHKSDSERDGET